MDQVNSGSRFVFTLKPAPSNNYTTCFVCGARLDHYSVLPNFSGHVICPDCLKSRDFGARLKEHVASLERRAEAIQQCAERMQAMSPGEWEVPTYEDWLAAEDDHEARWRAANKDRVAAAEPFLAKRMQETGCYFLQEWVTRSGDKPAMARALQARCSMQKVYIPSVDWGDEVVDQLLRFPAAKHDDKVDALANLGLALDHTHKAVIPKPWRRKRPLSWMTR